MSVGMVTNWNDRFVGVCDACGEVSIRSVHDQMCGAIGFGPSCQGIARELAVGMADAAMAAFLVGGWHALADALGRRNLQGGHR